MKKSAVFFALSILLLLYGVAMATAGSTETQQKPSLEESNLVTLKATVEELDLPNRIITIKGPAGNTRTFRVADSVKNLPQVKVGDELIVRFYQSLLIRVEQPGQAKEGVNKYATKATAEPGQKPAGVAVNSVTINTTIEAIDKANETVTLKGPNGKLQVVKARDPKNLEKVAVGDQVVITYTEALAIDLEKPKK
jgi:hypothetical protein